ncbi:unnamed protein product [Vitrella brassicaformis CCMP3155]|uniref:CENP-V/GFA domain-containing protein n=1 Tax=Vitrella brassicaformis (strain CCMP3155) TaxID=1169540 RepID=A0A0G4FDV6_VITBC|nr:unnamed protein product [Vitrella brassicaformis CCMP3155]|eukprot:CEM11054.1 unnamed protein product [Vitrella brassicaformis CCMP3155]
MSEWVEGGCLCGGQRFKVCTDPPPPYPPVMCCCKMCQRCLGAPAGVFLCVKEENLVLTSTEEVEKYESSPGNLRWFCGKCACQFYFQATQALPGTVDRPAV